MKIKELIKNKGFTKATLSRKLGISSQLIYNWEIGRCEPQLAMVSKLAAALCVTEQEIIDCFK